MRFKFKNPRLMVRAAKRLPSFFAGMAGVDALHFKDATAYVVGYDNWQDFLRLGVDPGITLGDMSPLDEDCDPQLLTQRREQQADRLTRFCAEHHVQLPQGGVPLVAAWRPTAGRPQEDTASFTEQERLIEQGEIKLCMRILDDLDGGQRIPSDYEVETVVRALRLVKGRTAEYVMTLVGPLATRLVNLRDGPGAAFGVRLLGALVANGFHYPLVSLARALRNGWGIAEDHPRALSLLTKALQEDSGEGGLFIETASYAELYWLASGLHMYGTNCPKNPARALELAVRAADHGHGLAAHFVAQFYLPMGPSGANDFWGVVPPDDALAEHWFRRAIVLGYGVRYQSFPGRN